MSSKLGETAKNEKQPRGLLTDEQMSKSGIAIQGSIFCNTKK